MEKDSKFDKLITCAANPTTSTVTLNAILKHTQGKDERAAMSPKIEQVQRQKPAFYMNSYKQRRLSVYNGFLMRGNNLTQLALH